MSAPASRKSAMNVRDHSAGQREEVAVVERTVSRAPKALPEDAAVS